MERVHDAGDPRLAPYRRLNDARYRATWERAEGLLIAEGTLAAGRLVASPYPVVSVLVSAPRVGAVGDLAGAAESAGAPVLVAPQEVVDAVAGFPVHRGVLAAGRRLPGPAVAEVTSRTGLILGVEGVNDAENMGALLRNAAAFGAGVVLDPTCCDHLSRRAVRVSVGHVLGLDVSRAASWPEPVAEAAAAGAAVIALTPAPGAAPLGPVLAGLAGGAGGAGGLGGGAGGRPRSVVLVVGAEGHGLRAKTVAATVGAAGYLARIPMAGGVDSLNVATAAAVALYAAGVALAPAGGSRPPGG